MNPLKRIIGSLHGQLVFGRRVQVISEMIGALLPQGASVLDIGTGDGRIAKLWQVARPDVAIEGIDVYVRGETAIPVRKFDGIHIPADSKSMDTVTFVDVLHHASDLQALLDEAARVSRKSVIIKDHLSENAFDFAVLKFMDWVGNAPHGVVLPYNYRSRRQWDEHFAASGLEIVSFETRVPLYPAPFDRVFGRGLHFITELRPRA
jgi:SAM-dependent methyltransferase